MLKMTPSVAVQSSIETAYQVPQHPPSGPRAHTAPWRRRGPRPVDSDHPHAAALTAFWEYLERQEALGRMVRRTCLEVVRVARTFLSAHPTLTLQQITVDHIEEYLASRSTAPRSLQTVLMRLRVFFRWATERQRLVVENPCLRVSRPRWRSVPRPAPTYEEFLAVCRQCRTLAEAALVEGLYYTGLRRNELRRLRVRAVDFARGRAAVLGKGGKHRTVLFPPHVADLWQALAGAPDHYLFRGASSPTRRAWGVGALGSTLRQLGEAAGLPYRLTMHVLRHGFFRLLKTRGVSVEVAARLGGHSNVQLTVHIYGQLDDDDLQSAYDRGMGEEPR